MLPFYIIFKEEIKSFLTSSWLLLIFSVFSLLLCVRYLIALDEFVQRSMMPQGKPPNIHDALFIPHLNWVYMTFLILIPLLGMRLISEEKKEKTMDLLLTSPLTSFDIVFGKFLAAWSMVVFMLFLAFLFPLATSLASDFDWGPLFGSYMGMILLGGLNVSICLMASTLTSSTVMSGFLGFLFILVTMIFGSSGMQVESEFMSQVLEQLSLGVHLHDFFQGILNIKSFVFMFSAIGLFLFIAQRMVEALRWK
jgi:ABC-2 type transport system permease protein